jgi:hypothetical protein
VSQLATEECCFLQKRVEDEQQIKSFDVFVGDNASYHSFADRFFDREATAGAFVHFCINTEIGLFEA